MRKIKLVAYLIVTLFLLSSVLSIAASARIDYQFDSVKKLRFEEYDIDDKPILPRPRPRRFERLYLSNPENVFENENFTVLVTNKNDNPVVNVNVSLFNEFSLSNPVVSKKTDEKGEVQLTAPEVSGSTRFWIRASKKIFVIDECYTVFLGSSALQVINLNQLYISISEIVNENEILRATITDEQGPVADAIVTFADTVKKTDVAGEASFTAPSVEEDTTFSIDADKIGYKSANSKVKILNVEENNAPTVDIVKPLDGTIVSGTIWVNASLMDPDGDSILERTLVIDGETSAGEFFAQGNPAPAFETKEFINQTVDTTMLSEGEHQITIRVRDEHGFHGEDSIIITVNNNVQDDVNITQKIAKGLPYNKTLQWLDSVNVSIGNVLTINITITNSGPYNLSNITIIEKLPTQLKFLISDFNYKNLTTENRTKIYECPPSVACINPGGKWQIHIPVLVVEEGIGNINFTVHAMTENNMEISNQDSVRINASDQNHLHVEQTITHPQVSSIPVGKNITFNVTLFNVGDYQLNNITVFAAIHGSTYVNSSVAPVYGSTRYDNISLIAWNINDSLDSDSTLSITYTTKGIEEGEKLSFVYAIAQSKDNELFLDSEKTFFSLLPKSTPPDKPTEELPENGNKEVSVNTNLSVYVFDVNDDKMNVTFYWGNGTEIATVHNVSSGTRAKIDLSALAFDTRYEWYVVVNDSCFENTSNVWNFTTKSNTLPDDPTKILPSSDVGISLNPTLKVHVSDFDGDHMNVSFYNAANDNLIDMVPHVANNSTASITWSNLQHSTNYNWYVIVNDSKNQIQSATWSFKTKSSSGGHHSGDNTAPTTSISISPASPNGENDWFTTKPIINLSLSEPGSIYYRWNSDEWKTYDSPLSADEGINTLHYYGEDDADNTESKQSYTFKVDTILEEPEAAFDESYNNLFFTYNENVTLMSFMLNEDEIKNKITREDNQTYVLSLEEVTDNEFHTLNITVKDKAGNQQTYTNVLDFVNPSILLDLEEGAQLSGIVNITAEADDGQGAIDSVAFYLGGECIKEDYYSPYRASLDTTNYEDGMHTLRVVATDWYGNTNSTTLEIEIRQMETSALPLTLMMTILAAIILIGIIAFLLIWTRKHNTGATSQKHPYPLLSEPEKSSIPEFTPLD